MQGSVYVYDNPGLCYWQDRINWSELFENPGEQEVYGKQTIEPLMGNKTMETLDTHLNQSFESVKGTLCLGDQECSPKCVRFSDEHSYCWGPGQTDCQHESRCNRISCGRCYKAKSQQPCCHEQCLGGCTGPLASQCQACKEYNNSGICQAHCPPQRISRDGELVDNPEFKYRLSGLCVSKCPSGFLIENDACVIHCSGPNSHTVNGVCRRCEGQCPKKCEITYRISRGGTHFEVLDAVLLQGLTNCTHLEGNLIITNESFYTRQTVPEHIPIGHVEQLWAMHSLREISGFVYLDLGVFGLNLQNLRFLENLVKVSGSQNNVRTSIMIMNSGALEADLRNLRFVPHGTVVFFNNSRLCYLHTLPWLISAKGRSIREHVDRSKVTGTMHILVESGPSASTCAEIGATCHQECDPNYGCWGPGRDQCIRCAHARAGEHNCVWSCTELPGFQMPRSKPDRGMISMTTERYTTTSELICAPCHPECGQTCSGPGADQCIGDCKTAWAEGKCVSQCQSDHYLNVDRRLCVPCQSHCHQRRLTNKAVCTGPGSHPGTGGCNKCAKLLIQNPAGSFPHMGNAVPHYKGPMNLLCIQGDCPPHTYLTTEIVRANDTVYARVAELYTTVLPVCRSCHPLCPQCSAFNLVRANEERHGCIICAGVWFRETCVNHCPKKEDTYFIEQRTQPGSNGSISHGTAAATLHITVKQSQTRSLNGECLACHRECHMGCWGPEASQCNHCSHVRVHWSLVSKRVRSGNEKLLQGQTRHMDEPQMKIRNPITHQDLGPFICLPKCLTGLPYLVTDPFSGDHLCHSEAKLSDPARQLILQETSRFMEQLPSFGIKSLETGPSTVDRHPQTNTVLVPLILISLVIIIAVVIYVLCRIRKRRVWIKKHCNQPMYYDSHPDKLFCPPWGAWKSGYKAQSHNNYLYADSLMSNSSMGFDSMRMRTFSPDSKNGRRKGQTGNMINIRTQKAPNLGRLIMIHSDDLMLDEVSGPLGTGAFGAVYRGHWRIPSDPTTSPVHVDEETRPCSTQSNAVTVFTSEDYVETETESSSFLHPFPPSTSTSRGTSGSGTGCPHPQQPHRLLPVAVKILNEVRGSSDLQALLDEAKSRKCLVSAYVMNGSLERYLRRHASSLSGQLLLNWSAQIADGMAYLQSRGIIHRDLATRNVLVTSRDQLQITDFGLAKMLEREDEENGGEVIVRSGRVPIRWLATETISHGRYSFRTDVWAYGVTIWEIFTFGKKPYERIETSGVKSHVLSGNRLPQPSICSPELYQVLLQCWDDDPHKRPNFNELFVTFDTFIKQPHKFVLSRTPSRTDTTDIDSFGGGDTRSRLTIYTTSQMPPEPCSEWPNDSTASINEDHHRQSSISTTNISASTTIHPTTNPSTRGTAMPSVFRRRPIRFNQLLQPDCFPTGRYARYQAQKRSSTGSRPTAEHQGTLSTSLSVTSSGMSDRWSHSAFPHHSHPTLVEQNRLSDTLEPRRPGEGPSNIPIPSGRHVGSPERSTELVTGMHIRGNTDSWASSGQPLLSSDPDSSMSQLVLTNLGYTSSDSRNSMAIPPAPLTPYNEMEDQADENQQTITASDGILDDHFLRTMPPNFVIEAATNYVWPQWPHVSQLSTTTSSSIDSTQAQDLQREPGSSLTPSERDLQHLHRQVWLRRNESRHQFYVRQSRLRHSALEMSLPEQASEEALEEEMRPGASVWQFPFPLTGNGRVGSEENPVERYCPDPTMSVTYQQDESLQTSDPHD